MAKTMLCLAVLYFATTSLVLAQNEGKYLCTRHDASDATKKGRVTIELTLAAKPLVIFAENKADSCGSGATANSKTDITIGTASPYSFTLDAAAAPDNCGFNFDGTSKSTITIVAGYVYNGIVSSPGFKFVIECDWSQATSSNKKTAAATAVSGDAATGTSSVLTQAEIDGLLTLEVRDKGDPAANTPVEPKVLTAAVPLGDEIGIYIKLDNTNLVKGIKAKNLIVDSIATVDSAKKKTIIDENGCGNQLQISATSTIFANTVKCELNTDVTLANHVFFKCGPNFGAFRFEGAVKNVYFQVTVDVCGKSDDAACTFTCPPSGRKRRDATRLEGNVTATTLSTSLTVALKNEISQQKQDGDAATLAQCVNHVTWLAVVSVLALLLVITLFVALYFGSTVIRSRTAGSKTEYPNPAYKA